MLTVVLILLFVVVIMAFKIKNLNESDISQTQLENNGSEIINEYVDEQENKDTESKETENISITNDITTNVIEIATTAAIESIIDETTEPIKQTESAYIGKIGIVNTESTPLNLRSYNDIHSEIIGSIPKGAEVKIIESPLLNPSGSEYRWYLVEYENVIGYVDTNFIETTEDTFELSDAHLSAIIQLRFFEARDAIEWQYSPCFA